MSALNLPQHQKSLLHRSIHSKIPAREFNMEDDAERNKDEQRNERSLRAKFSDIVMAVERSAISYYIGSQKAI